MIYIRGLHFKCEYYEPLHNLENVLIFTSPSIFILYILNKLNFAVGTFALFNFELVQTCKYYEVSKSSQNFSETIL